MPRTGSIERVRIAAGLEGRVGVIGARLAAGYRSEIVEYRSLPPGFVEKDVIPTASGNLEHVLTDFVGDMTCGPDHLDEFRASVRRRLEQGVPAHALLKAYRLWGTAVWDEIRRNQLGGLPGDQGLLMELASRIMRHVDSLSTSIEQMSTPGDRSVTGRQAELRRWLEVLIQGTDHPLCEEAGIQVGLPSSGGFRLVVVRRLAADPGGPPPVQALAEALGADGAEDSVLVVAHRTEAVALWPAEGGDLGTLRRQLDLLAERLASHSIGVSREHSGPLGVATAHVDAFRAARECPSLRRRTPRAHTYADAVVADLLVENDLRNVLHREVLMPLREYDAIHESQLLLTLHEFHAADFNLSKAAAALHAQPNTVKYRLRRIRSIVGLDPQRAGDYALLALALALDSGH